MDNGGLKKNGSPLSETDIGHAKNMNRKLKARQSQLISPSPALVT